MTEIGGSSPRVRGTRQEPVAVIPERRFIPACTGNSKSRPAATSGGSVHPRVYGELAPAAGPAAFALGSSPRVRGTRGRKPTRRGTIRFIPACTGNSISRSSVFYRVPVHPRVYGELASRCSAIAGRPPVHPRVYGELRPLLTASLCPLRFIPACTGNSIASPPAGAWPPVHPRVYGELFCQFVDHPRLRGSSPRVRGTRFLFSSRGLLLGSSPRVRGTPAMCPVSISLLRFIPACTGNSRRGRRGRANETVHPRVYGELSSRSRVTSSLSGSSPRVRGTPARVNHDRINLRFIPACTGNSRPPWSQADFSRFIPACTGNSSGTCRIAGRKAVHPRVYGELLSLPDRGQVQHGSSPRVRGTLDDALRRQAAPRFIPACTGNSGCHVASVAVLAVHPRVYGEL